MLAETDVGAAFGGLTGAWAYCVLAVVLVVASVTDIRTGKIYNVVTYPAVAIGLIGHLLVDGLGFADQAPMGLAGAAVGLAVGLLPLLAAWMAGGIGGGEETSPAERHDLDTRRSQVLAHFGDIPPVEPLPPHGDALDAGRRVVLGRLLDRPRLRGDRMHAQTREIAKRTGRHIRLPRILPTRRSRSYSTAFARQRACLPPEGGTTNPRTPAFNWPADEYSVATAAKNSPGMVYATPR